MPVARTGIDLVALHWHLWDLRDVHGTVEFSQAELAEKLCVTRGRIAQVVGDLERENRLRSTPTRGRYVVTDPAV